MPKEPKAPRASLSDRGRAESAGAPARQDALRRHNLALALGEVARRGPISRAQLANRVGLTKGTVSTLVDTLIDAGLVHELTPEAGLVGRPGSPLALNPDGPAALGLDINSDYTAACLVDMTGRVRERVVDRRDNRADGPAPVLDSAAAIATRLMRAAHRAGLRVAGVGVGVPGLVDADGLLRVAPNLPGWHDIAVAEMLRDRLDVTTTVTSPKVGAGARDDVRVVRVDNEANLAALGELWYGGDTTARDFVYVSGEIGVGAGIVVRGRLFRGVRGFAGELGHVTVDPSGPPCGCGSRGCLEQVAGQDAILRAAGITATAGTLAGDPDGSAAELTRRARAGDSAAVSALVAAGRCLGIALSAVLNLVDVPVVVLGGLYAATAPWVRPAVADELRARVVANAWAPVEVVVSKLGSEAAMRGAAGVALRRILDDPAAYLLGLRG